MGYALTLPRLPISLSSSSQLSEINRHPWVTAGGKSELELELPMMEVVQTHVIPTISAIDTDILNSICSLGCFKDREKLIQELLTTQYVAFYL
jgi:BR serine/threonine kinase